MSDAPILVRRALVAPRYLTFCRICPAAQGPAFTGWPGALIGHAKRPGEATDLGRAHLTTKHPQRPVC